MKYGCIGEHLKHSFSKEIHTSLADYQYELFEIAPEGLEAFVKEADFLAINVTIPYKEAIMPYLYYIDEHAKMIGAVNTVVNRGGKLYGYNTDFYGMSMLIEHAKIDIKNKKVAILGTGGTSKTAKAVASALGASVILRVSRSGNEDAITYEELYSSHADTEVIINTTPAGMFPNIYSSPVDISRFQKLCGVVDAVYNPLRTPLILAAKKRGIAAEGGLYMLVAQAVRASEIFLDTKYSKDTLNRVFSEIYRNKENIVLTGMPASGKSTVGAILAKSLCREFIDTDKLIEERAKMAIPEIFKKHGEAYFRELESEVVKDAAKATGAIISTGGGVVLRENNVNALRENGRIYFIDRPLEALIPTEDRPLASDKEAITKRYNERYGIYNSTADNRIDASVDADTVAKLIKEDFYK